MHTHQRATLTLVMGGAYSERFDDAYHRCTSMCVQFKPPGVPHTTVAGSGGVHMFIAEVDANDLSQDDCPTLVRPGVPTALALGLLSIGADQLQNRMRGLLQTVRDRRPHDDDEHPEWIVEARDKLRRLEPSATSASALARQQHVHPVYLARVFGRHFGCSVGTFLRRSRIDRAVDSLLFTDITLSSLAHDLGYFDQSHFTHDFRRETGTTPHTFRRSASRLAAFPGCDITSQHI